MANAPDLAPYWMPFTANAAFKRERPPLFVSASGNHYADEDGRRILDAMAGLWCVNAGHRPPRVVAAIKAMAERLDYVSSFGMGHPAAFDLAAALARIAPPGLDRAFFVNSGSEAVDTALKIARAYHRARGEASRVKFVGRARAYHGMGFGGLAVAGLARHRKDFGPLIGEVMHLPSTYDRARQAFSLGQPEWGAERADALEEMIAVHDASTIAAVIVEPVAGSGGVFPPPVGYLDRLRATCDRHGILLIFDEVITGFGRLGTAFAAQALGVTPDLIATAKGLTNGAVPMGAVLASRTVHDALEARDDGAVGLMHGYTYSGHPLACAAGLATLETYAAEGLFERAGAMAPHLARAVHALRGLPGVLDVRNIGILAAVDLDPGRHGPGKRGPAAAAAALDRGVLVRATGDMLVISPPLTFGEAEYAELGDALRHAVTATAA